MTIQEETRNLGEKIQQREALEARRSEVVAELSGLGSVQSLGVATGDARHRLTSFINQYGGGSEGRVPGARKAALGTLKRNYEQAKEASTKARERHSQLKEERESLTEQLSNWDYSCNQQEIQAFQDALTKATDTVAGLKVAISEQEELIQQATASIPSLGDLPQQREDLLASIAIGEASEDDLSEIDQKIEEKELEVSQTSTEASQVISKAEQAIAGLKRKLSEAESELATLEDQSSQVLSHYLVVRAEVEGAEYARLAEKLAEKYQRLIGLGTLLEGCAEKSWDKRIITGPSRRVCIPSFALDSCKGQETGLEAHLFSNEGINPPSLAALEKERIQGEGVTLL
ncbi:MAG: hypothetical protein OET90_02010 [Desulfuromonadales bacterium]|nr:hypothetical protein [Desulfuromonadales bacterium]